MRKMKFVPLSKRSIVLYRNIIIATTILGPFLNRYQTSPINILISCLLGFFVGILVCLFHYELFNKDRRSNVLFHSVKGLIFSLVALTIIVDAIGRAFIIGLLKIGWIPHLILMVLIYLFLGAVISAESARSNFQLSLVVIKFILLLILIRAIFVIVFTVTNVFTSALGYNLILLLITNVMGFLLLLPGIFIGYKKRNFFSI